MTEPQQDRQQDRRQTPQQNAPDCCACRAGAVLCLLVLAAAGMFAAARSSLVKSAVARWLDTGSVPPSKADFAYVLGGGLATRPAAAAAIFRQGRVDRVLVSHIGAAEAVERGETPSHHDLTVQILSAFGVPREKISIIGKNCTTTHDEVAALADFLSTKPEASVILVTEFFHARRSHWTALRVLGSDRRIAVFSAPGDGFDADSWWRDYRGVGAVLSEYSRTAFYVFRYGRAALWLAICTAAGIIWYYLICSRAATVCGASATAQTARSEST